MILAAGFGSRLGAASGGLPKALAPVLGRPLLSYTLEALAQAGVREAHVVLGHRGAEVEAALAGFPMAGLALHTVWNAAYTLANGSSLAAARLAVAGRPFLLLMADHLLSVEAIRRMADAEHEFAIGVDRGPLPPERLADATRVRLRATGLVAAFGKRLRRWDGIDAGIFRCLPPVFGVIDELGIDSELSAIMTAVAARRPFHAVDLTGAFWLDVDTPKDLATAEALLRHG
ncbi:MAG TPA: NTP transferase domain-containing protein [Dehalococcoidia bacterium]